MDLAKWIRVKKMMLIATSAHPPCLLSSALNQSERNGLDPCFVQLVEKGRVPVFDLATQRRMHPDIADLIRPAVYPNLMDAAHVKEYPSVRGMRRHLFFWDHAIKEDKSGTLEGSKTNRYFAHYNRHCAFRDLRISKIFRTLRSDFSENEAA